MTYNYKAKLVRVIDGDTIVFNIDLGFNTFLNNYHVRLAGINTPETRTKDLVEKAKGMAAKEYVENLLHKSAEKKGTEFILYTEKSRDSFGRYVAWVDIISPNGDVIHLNSHIVEMNLGVYKEY